MSEQELSEEQRALRNSIFAAAKAAGQAPAGDPSMGMPQQHPHMPVANAIDYGPAISAGTVPLPSLGLVYGPSSPLHRADLVEIKAMTAKEEDILMSKALIRKGTVITELVKSCVMDKSIDVSSMLSGDKMALMVAIRITGYGAEYPSKVICPACEQSQEDIIDLTGLNVRELDLTKVDQAEPFENLFTFRLPVSQKVVHYKFLTGRDEDTILQTIEAKKKKGVQNDNLMTTRLLTSILAIDGRNDRNYISQFISGMPARDSYALRSHIDKNEPGIDMKADFTCQNCSHSEEVGIQLGPAFFWPGT